MDTIRRSKNGISRVEIVERTGLASQTISNVCRRLLDEGWIEEGDKRIVGPGKPRVMLRLAPRGAFAVGVHLDPAVITYAVTDLADNVVAHQQRSTPSASKPEELIAIIVTSVEAIMNAPGVQSDRVLGIGIASPGPIDSNRGLVLDPPLLEGWREVALRDSLAEATNLPVVLEKDVTSAVVAELWLGRASAGGDFAFFYFGSGIGIGLALGGDVYRGSTGNEPRALSSAISGLMDGLGQLRTRLLALTSSMTQNDSPATADVNASWVETLGWFHGWSFPVSLTPAPR